MKRSILTISLLTLLGLNANASSQESKYIMCSFTSGSCGSGTTAGGSAGGVSCSFEGDVYGDLITKNLFLGKTSFARAGAPQTVLTEHSYNQDGLSVVVYTNEDHRYLYSFVLGETKEQIINSAYPGENREYSAMLYERVKKVAKGRPLMRVIFQELNYDSSGGSDHAYSDVQQYYPQLCWRAD